MRVPFIKMHGLGNDFVVLDARVEALPPIGPAMAAALADRRTGIGCDQLIILEPSEAADFRMRIFNPDGGEVEACGNASRAVALLHGQAARVETAGGQITVEPTGRGARIDMGEPRFEWNAIPLAYAVDTAAMPVAWEGLETPSAVNVGNPHAVFFVPDLDAVPLELLGPEIEHDT
jgi:diaminopimelate epimerase